MTLTMEHLGVGRIYVAPGGSPPTCCPILAPAAPFPSYKWSVSQRPIAHAPPAVGIPASPLWCECGYPPPCGVGVGASDFGNKFAIVLVLLRECRIRHSES